MEFRRTTRERLKEIEAAFLAVEQRVQRAPTEEEVAARIENPAPHQESLSELRAVSLGSLDEVSDGFSESKLLRFVAQAKRASISHLGASRTEEFVGRQGISKMPKQEKIGLVLLPGTTESARDCGNSWIAYHSRLPAQVGEPGASGCAPLHAQEMAGRPG